MPCPADELRHVPLFSLLDEDELAVLSQQVELRNFTARQRIYKVGDPGKAAYVMLSGAVQVFTVDGNQQDVLVDEPRHGGLFGFASMLEVTAHQTTAIALEDSTCVEVDRHDIAILLEKKPMAGMDMLTVLARQSHALQQLVRDRANRNSNHVIEEEMNFGERIADRVASFGGSWTFIILFGLVLVLYSGINIALKGKAWDPYPFILLNLFLSMLASIQAPVIMMSQNRQDKKDRVRAELDFEVNVRAEAEIQELSRKLRLLTDRVDDVDEKLTVHQPS